MDLDKIRNNLQKRINHQQKWEKHVVILTETDTDYSVLFWNYNNHDVKARSKDLKLLHALKETIEMYLEEVENK